MRLIHPKLHALLDYCIAVLAILSPVLFSFGDGKSETVLPLAFGLLIILYSFFTDYPLGMARQIPFELHLRMDQLAAILMIASPWLFNFADEVYIPHVALGLALFISSVLAGNDILHFIQSIRQRPWEKWFRIPGVGSGE